MTKRAFDIALALILIPLTMPLLGGVALAVWVSMGHPVLFAQRRAGRNGEEFTLRKFRTMRDLRDTEGDLLPDEMRVTPVGQFLRRTRLDELPELFLILTGKMSFVGPRPLYKSTVEANELGWKRGETRPGLTGLAQVSGNTQLSNREKFALDAYYVDRRGRADDLLILYRTVTVVLFGERRNDPLIRRALEYANGFDRRC